MGDISLKPISTERLVLRPLTEDDEEAVFRILNDETTTAGVSWRQPTREGARAWLHRRIEDDRTRGASMSAVEQRGTSEVVGLCGFFPRESQLELGYVIHAQFWRRGFAKEAVRACVEQAVRSGYRIYATIRPMNGASIRVAESAGLRLTRKIEDDRGGLLVYESMRLIHPSPDWKEAFLDLARDHANAGEPRYDSALRDFDAYFKKTSADAKPRLEEPTWVPQSEFWLEELGVIIGVIRIRYWLTDGLKIEGGHIGYAIRPSMRRMRYGTRLLALGLEEAKRLGINPVLVTVDATNLGSIKVIEANGGQLDGRTTDPHRRYWIHL